MTREAKELLEAYHDKIELVRSGAKPNIFETKADQKIRIKGLMASFAECSYYYFEHYMLDENGNRIDLADFQEELAKLVMGDPTCKILVRWGRGLAKSVICNIFIPFWLWINGETWFMVLIGNTLDKAKLLLADLQAEFEANARIIHDFGEQIVKGSWMRGQFKTKNGFFAKALGMGQSTRGLRKGAKRPDLISADDLEDQETAKNPFRQQEIVDWLLKDVIPTMDGPRRRYLHPNNDPFPESIQNKLEKERITGIKNAKWKLHKVCAYDPKTYKPRWKAKYSDTYYRELEEEIGVLAAHAEYNHEGIIQGKIFKSEMIQWKKRPRLDHFDTLMSVWDVAFSGNNDFNAIPVWGSKDRDLWKVKQFCRKCEIPEALEFMYAYNESLPEGVSILWMVEKQFWNQPLENAIEEAELLHGYSLNIMVIERPRMDKLMRMLTMYPVYQSKRIYYADSEVGDEDMKTANRQLFGIDYGYKGHDDAPDADEQTVHEMLKIIRTDKPDSIRTTSRSQIISRQKNRF